MNINVVVIGGNLTKDPDCKLVGATPCAEFSLAINYKYKANDGSIKEDVDFIAVVAWGKNADTAGQFLHKGDPCVIEGRIKQSRWTDAEGKNHSKTKV